MSRFYSILSIIVIFFILQACNGEPKEHTYTLHDQKNIELKIKNVSTVNFNKPIDFTTFNLEPTEWGENVTGVKTSFATNKKEMALTFDACGGEFGNQVDYQLLDFLRKENIPATLFINEQWINENEALFMELADDPLFQLENHGTRHLPLSVSGGEAWGIHATTSPEEVYEEIMANHDTVKKLTGENMTLFRSGTAFYDEIAVEIANELGYEVVNFDILGDAGATYSSQQVTNALLTAKPGSIALLHMNQPKSGTANGVINAVPRLQAEGYDFVQLKDNKLK